jgi:predicted nuclease of predicted toxin-antitoxin system
VKLLLDQNLSPRLVRTLEGAYPGSTHVRLVGLRDADDAVVWEYARDHNFVIVSKDSDFHQRSFLFGFPPKVIWIRRGNCPTADIEKIFGDHQSHILKFCEDSLHAFLALS